MMPGETGLEFLRYQKRQRGTSIVSAAMSDAENRIEGLEAGLIIFQNRLKRELVLQLNGFYQPASSPNTKVVFGPFHFNPNTGMLSKLGERIHITTAEQQLLTSFGKQPNQILSRDDLGLNWMDEWKDVQLTLPLQGFVAN